MFDASRRPITRKFTAASSHYLRTPQSVFTSNGPFTFACWFMANDITSYHTLISVQRSTSFERGYALVADGSTAGDPIRLRHHTGTAQHLCSTTTGFTANRWHHAACAQVSGTNNAKVFLDGGGKGVGNGNTLSASPDYFYIGAGIASGTTQNHLDGYLAWPCIWNVILSDNDIFALSQGVHPMTIKPESIVAFWDWSGMNLEVNPGFNQGAYVLTNSGSLPVTMPIHLRTRVPRPWLMFNPATIAPKAFHHRQQMMAH